LFKEIKQWFNQVPFFVKKGKNMLFIEKVLQNKCCIFLPKFIPAALKKRAVFYFELKWFSEIKRVKDQDYKLW